MWENTRLACGSAFGIAQAIMEDPEILILDEPMNDWITPVCRIYGHCCWSSKAQGKTILLASHNHEDIAALCDTVHEGWTAGFYCNDIRFVAE